MRRFGLAVVAAVLAFQGSVQAGERQFLIFVWDDGRPTQQHYHAQPAPVLEQSYSTQPTYQYEQHPAQTNVFGQLIELENRKNAWLRRTFFGAR